MEVLDGVDHHLANERPIAGAHSIAELVPHVTTWMDAVRRRLGGDWSIVSDEDNFPSPATTAEAWSQAVAQLREATEALERALEQDVDLDRLEPDGRFTVLQLVVGAVQHNLYHAGQIAILRIRE